MEVKTDDCGNGRNSNAKKKHLYRCFRGIGIISVVLGHAIGINRHDQVILDLIFRFIYIFHLPVFFFVSGYLLNIPKSVADCKKLVKKSIYSLYFPYLCSCFILSVMLQHDQIIDIHNIFSILRLEGRTSFATALWFVPCILVCRFVFASLELTIKKIGRLHGGKIIKYVECLIYFTVVIAGFLRIFYNRLSRWSISTALCMVPVMKMGGVYRSKQSAVDGVIEAWMIIPTSIVIFLLNYYTGKEIELAHHHLYGYIGLYPMIILGLTFCLSLTKLIQKNKVMTKIISKCGEYSYYIMAYHFAVFFFIDYVIVSIMGLERSEIKFPATFTYAIPAYLLIGCVIPGLFGRSIKKWRIIINGRFCWHDHI